MIGEPSRPSRTPLLLGIAGGVVGAAGLVALVLSLGSWAYHHRRFTLHDGRLKRLVQQHPAAPDVTRALLEEPGNAVLRAPESEQELYAMAAQWSAARADEVVRKRRQWPTMTIFLAGDMVYFLYFDAEAKLRDYVLLSN